MRNNIYQFLQILNLVEYLLNKPTSSLPYASELSKMLLYNGLHRQFSSKIYNSKLSIKFEHNYTRLFLTDVMSNSVLSISLKGLSSLRNSEANRNLGK